MPVPVSTTLLSPAITMPQPVAVSNQVTGDNPGSPCTRVTRQASPTEVIPHVTRDWCSAASSGVKTRRYVITNRRGGSHSSIVPSMARP